MDNQNKFIMFFDIDGTIRFKHDLIPLSVIWAIKKAQKEGNLAIINTGRSKFNIPKSLNIIRWDGYICGAAYAELNGKVVLQERIPKDTFIKMCEISDKYNIPIIFDGEGKSYSLNSIRYRKLKNIDEAIQRFDEIKANKIQIQCELSDEVRDEFSKYMYCIPMHGYYDAFIFGCSKAKGMQVICDSAGISRENTLACGDNFNDMDMLSYAHYSVAMPHAPKELKAIATYCPKLPFIGVYCGIKKYLLNRVK